ncbi:sulfotransferase domain-containing protein [Candidatus Magnetomorum sp. HK-1]|nr:sulfotransferase domain-containing protein [Candidatus Magnetomorum sp. HK-1]
MKNYLPNLIIIGAPKCGTSSMHFYLGLHPQIYMSQPKELNFFQLEKNWDKGESWYRSHFIKAVKVRGESSPMYSNCIEYPDVPERMHAMIPDARLIYILRDPVKRIISHHVHATAVGLSSGSIEECLELPDNNYIQYSKYFMQLNAYLKYYPLSQICILTSEELYYSRYKTVQKVFRFLGVDSNFYSNQFTTLKNTYADISPKSPFARYLDKITNHDIRFIIPETIRSSIRRVIFSKFKDRVSKPILDNKLKMRLINCLKDDTDQLRGLTNRKFERWCI